METKSVEHCYVKLHYNNYLIVLIKFRGQRLNVLIDEVLHFLVCFNSCRSRLGLDKEQGMIHLEISVSDRR